MSGSGLFRGLCIGSVFVAVAACGGREAPATSELAASGSSPEAQTAQSADDPCPLTMEQVMAVTGAPMTLPPGGCTFFPANGRDIPHVFYILQTPMVCGSITPGDMGFTEPVEGLPARAAYVRDVIDGSHVLVCRQDARAFDIVVDIRGDRVQNREVAVALAREVLAGR